tara:strand:+ start:3108 stop:3560 length:453 start_codon:yes stop_codon:yes gene_type:complete
MSHVANVEVEINDLTALKTACDKLGLEFKQGQTTYEWFNSYLADSDVGRQTVRDGFKPEDFGKCEHAIKVPGSEYEVGVVKSPTGNGYRLIYDEYGSQGQAITKRLGGTQLTKLKTEYGVARATSHLRRNGYRVARRVLANGTVKITGVQ